MENVFFTVDEVSSILKITSLTLYKYIREGILEAVQIGGHYRIEKEALERFIQSHKVTSFTPKPSETSENTFAQVDSEIEREES